MTEKTLASQDGQSVDGLSREAVRKLVRLAYEAYGEAEGPNGPWKPYDSRPMPRFDELLLMPDGKINFIGAVTVARWEAAVRAVVLEVLRIGGLELLGPGSILRTVEGGGAVLQAPEPAEREVTPADRKLAAIREAFGLEGEPDWLNRLVAVAELNKTLEISETARGLASEVSPFKTLPYRFTSALSKESSARETDAVLPLLVAAGFQVDRGQVESWTTHERFLAGQFVTHEGAEKSPGMPRHLAMVKRSPHVVMGQSWPSTLVRALADAGYRTTESEVKGWPEHRQLEALYFSQAESSGDWGPIPDCVGQLQAVEATPGGRARTLTDRLESWFATHDELVRLLATIGFVATHEEVASWTLEQRAQARAFTLAESLGEHGPIPKHVGALPACASPPGSKARGPLERKLAWAARNPKPPSNN